MNILQTKNFGKSAKEVNQEDQMLTSLLTNGLKSETPSRKKKGQCAVSQLLTATVRNSFIDSDLTTL